MFNYIQIGYGIKNQFQVRTYDTINILKKRMYIQLYCSFYDQNKKMRIPILC